MPTIFERRHPPIRKERPSEAQIMAEGFKKRCPQCWWVWPASKMTEESGIEKCPNCLDIITPELKAQAEENFAALQERYVPEPQISQAPLAIPIPPAINSITDANGVKLSSAEPLHLQRNVVAVVNLNGIRFAASDVITYSSGITNAVPIQRPSDRLTILTIAASLAMVPGDHYHLTFNGQTYRDIFSVR